MAKFQVGEKAKVIYLRFSLDIAVGDIVTVIRVAMGSPSGYLEVDGRRYRAQNPYDYIVVAGSGVGAVLEDQLEKIVDDPDSVKRFKETLIPGDRSFKQIMTKYTRKGISHAKP
jgi:hypothetical protein